MNNNALLDQSTGVSTRSASSADVSLSGCRSNAKPILTTTMLKPGETASHGHVLPLRRKRGGRKKGSRNKRTLERAKAIEAIKASGNDPISFFADLLRNESAPLDLRFQAAKELAPFVHPKLSSIEARSGGKTHEERLAELRRMKAAKDKAE